MVLLLAVRQPAITCSSPAAARLTTWMVMSVFGWTPLGSTPWAVVAAPLAGRWPRLNDDAVCPGDDWMVVHATQPLPCPSTAARSVPHGVPSGGSGLGSPNAVPPGGRIPVWTVVFSSHAPKKPPSGRGAT